MNHKMFFYVDFLGYSKKRWSVFALCRRGNDGWLGRDSATLCGLKCEGRFSGETSGRAGRMILPVAEKGVLAGCYVELPNGLEYWNASVGCMYDMIRYDKSSSHIDCCSPKSKRWTKQDFIAVQSIHFNFFHETKTKSLLILMGAVTDPQRCSRVFL